MNIKLITQEDLQEINKRLDSILAQQTEKAKKELLRQPVSNQEFIKLMGISSRCAQNWRDRGIIEFYKIGDKIFYSWEAIHAMLETHKVKSFKGL